MKRLLFLMVMVAVAIASGCATVQTADEREKLATGSYYLDSKLVRAFGNGSTVVDEGVVSEFEATKAGPPDYDDYFNEDTEYGDDFDDYDDDKGYQEALDRYDDAFTLGISAASAYVKDYDEEDGSLICLDFTISDSKCPDARIYVFVDGELLTPLCPTDPARPDCGVRLKQVEGGEYESHILVPWDGRLRDGKSITPGMHTVSLFAKDATGHKFREDYELEIEDDFYSPDLYFDPLFDGLFIFEVLFYLL